MISLFMMVIVLFLAHRNSFPREEVNLSWKGIKRVSTEAVPALIMPIIVLGVVIAGVATAT